MPYEYEVLREKIFTEEGQRMFLIIRDETKRLLKISGAVMSSKLLSITCGDTWMMCACIDRMVELKELKEIKNPYSGAGQHRIFIAG